MTKREKFVAYVIEMLKRRRRMRDRPSQEVLEGAMELIQEGGDG